jgi:hypothetical protein
MTVVRFRVPLEDPEEAEEVAALLEARLGGLEAVDEVQAEPEEPQAIGEIVMVVAGAVAVTRGGRDIVASLRQTVDELKALVESWRGLKRTILVEVADDEVDVREVGERELETIAEEST